jgi:phosphoglycolate phosphatase
VSDLKLIIFDWDGTLYDSVGSIVNSIQAAGKAIDKEISDHDARYIIGMGIVDAAEYLLPGLQDPAILKQFRNVYRDEYMKHQDDITLFPGAADLVRALAEKGYLLAVATGKSRRGINEALKTSNLEKFFFTTRTPDECLPKPNPEMVLEILAEADCTPDQALVIGDTTHDLLMASNAKVKSVGVLQGAHSEKDLLSANPARIFQGIPDLSAWLLAR